MAHRRVRLSADVRGATAVEYGLICALLVLAIIGGIHTLAGGKESVWGGVHDKVIGA